MKNLFLSLIMILCFVSCTQTKQDILHGTNPTDVLIADETYWIMPQDDDFGRSIIFTFNEVYTEQLDDFQGVERIHEELLDEGCVTWFLITDSNLNGYNIVKTIEDRLKPHVCIDNTHATFDGKCECDGLGCN